MSLTTDCRPKLVWRLVSPKFNYSLHSVGFKRSGQCQQNIHLLVHMVAGEARHGRGWCFTLSCWVGSGHRVLWTVSAKSSQREGLSQEIAEHLPSISEWRRNITLPSGGVEEIKPKKKPKKQVILANKYDLSLSTSWKVLAPGNIKYSFLAAELFGIAKME